MPAQSMQPWRRVRRALSFLQSGLGRRADAADRRVSQLEATRRQYDLAELLVEPIFFCGPEYDIAFANLGARRLLHQLGHTEASGLSLQAIFAGDQAAVLGRWFDLLWSTPDEPRRLLTKLADPLGMPWPIELRGTSYQDGSGLQAQLVVHDLRSDGELTSPGRIFDRSRLNEQLIQAIALPLSLRDTQGRFLWVNRAFEQTHHIPRHWLTGRRATGTLPEELAEALTRHDLEAAVSPAPIDYEYQVRGTGGDRRHVQVRVQALQDEDGHVGGVIAVEADVTRLRDKEGELTQANQRLERVSMQLIGAQEDERRRISRDLHDQVGQILTALKMQLVSLSRGDSIADPAQALHAPIGLAEEALRQTRDLTASLHPHLLEDLGLEPALSWLIERFIRPSLPNVELRCRLVPARAPGNVELAVFRVVQEALTNVVRHANASRAGVIMESRDGELQIEVIDDGDGFEAGNTWFDLQRATSVGVAAMQKRVTELGGQLMLDSTPGVGTSVRVLLPWWDGTQEEGDAHPAG